jgi:hypothetical protein
MLLVTMPLSQRVASAPVTRRKALSVMAAKAAPWRMASSCAASVMSLSVLPPPPPYFPQKPQNIGLSGGPICTGIMYK